MEPIFRHDVRAIILQNDKVLTCKLVGRHSFFPGGGVNLGERAADALVRELQEELDITARIKGFLGVYEWLWNDETGQPHHNISHFFEVEAQGLDSGVVPTSNEDHLEFQWASADQIAGWPVYPEPIHLMVRALMNGERRPWWFSETKRLDVL